MKNNSFSRTAADRTLSAGTSATHVDQNKKVSKLFRAHVLCTFNNVIITITDLKGDKLVSSSSGAEGFKGPEKTKDYAAKRVAKAVASAARAKGVYGLEVVIKGIGPGKDYAVKFLEVYGLSIEKIVYWTSVAHNGCRAPKQRKV